VRAAPFRPDDLENLGYFLDRANAVVPMETVADGLADEHMIGMRHDCDNVIVPAVRLAEWEARHGYRSTYYILHTSPYWQDKPLLCESLDQIASYGHNIGIHNDAITVALETGRHPSYILEDAIAELRGYGHTIRSTVAHGNGRCHVDHYVNDEMFSECYRNGYGGILRLGFNATPLAEFGLEFDANWLPRGDYISDSGGEWSQPFDELAAAWPAKGQLHMLVHPDWWADAFTPVEVAA
jgi:hypothetical protein